MVFPNGNVPESARRPVAGGGSLVVEAAAAWNELAARIYRETGLKIAPNGSYSTYRTIPMQQEMKAQYGANAATPGTSNHGYALAVDTDDHYLVNRYGAPAGFQKAWSDASWEPWHFKYRGDLATWHGEDPGPDYSDEPPKPKWWKRVGNRIEQARERRLSKKQRRRQLKLAKKHDELTEAQKKRMAELHREVGGLTRLIDRLVRRRERWGGR